MCPIRMQRIPLGKHVTDCPKWPGRNALCFFWCPTQERRRQYQGNYWSNKSEEHAAKMYALEQYGKELRPLNLSVWIFLLSKHRLKPIVNHGSLSKTPIILMSSSLHKQYWSFSVLRVTVHTCLINCQWTHLQGYVELIATRNILRSNTCVTVDGLPPAKKRKQLKGVCFLNS